MLAEVSFPVRYAETDLQRVVYYANYLAWFELGYEALFSALGRPLGEVRPAVLEATCRYEAPIHYGETVTVQSAPVPDEEGLRIVHRVTVGEELRACGTTLLERTGVEPGPAADLAGEHLDGWRQLQPRGRMEEIPLQVRYAETEPSRGAHFSRYFAWFEVGRIAFLHRIGLHYTDLESSGSPFVIAWAGCRYLAPVTFDDRLQIAVWVEEVRRRAFALGYRFVHPDGRLAAVGKTVQVFIAAPGRPAEIPEKARELLAGFQESSPQAASRRGKGGAERLGEIRRSDDPQTRSLAET